MHELGLCRNILAIVSEHAGDRPVRRVRVAVGPLACVERPALAFCWGVVTEGTGLAAAELAFVEAEGDTFLIKDYELEEAA
ncbi:hypothetical protein LNKW23_06850 [Paralimibaculum aggregatum]|uniref:Hydrogenase maturation nickel metallochaperone HypA n=1 Tax=Paralimibaculum aggregatum TaxID=3036245 RepID=A0ABQ6LII9_9RHOB|nr:hydrogenase/urease maturation nickel metallochaperone HypA [Limibaculum sp. NKW23]GMG81472.1 hypothetical protein LNKW23_06850 [Limibaculum sp. NKW23]